MRRAIETVCVGAVLASVALSSGNAASAPAKPKAGKGGAGEAVALSAASVAELKSDDVALVRAGLDDARLAGTKAAPAVPQIVLLLRSGLPYSLAEAAIDTLSDIESPEVEAYVPYARHRDPKVRRAAVRALGKVTSSAGAPVATGVLRAALADPDALVRATAAIGLGSLKAHAALPDLFLALDRHVYEAAVSIGQLCTGADCDALVARMGKIPFDVLTTGIEPLLFRPEVSDEAKVLFVDKVRDVGTGDANKFLRGLQTRWPKNGSPRVRREVDAAVLATMSSPGAGS
jgi:hypothetical protein